jgi:hypothetical protein
MVLQMPSSGVTPAKAGVQGRRQTLRLWIPACAGMANAI